MSSSPARSHPAPRGRNTRRSEGDHRELDTPRRQNDEPQRVEVPLTWVTALAVGPMALASLVLVVTLLRLLRHLADAETFSSLPQLQHFVLGGGVVVLTLLAPRLNRWLRALYVLGHESSHWLAVKLCGGRVEEFVWGANGGWITADRSNIFITLAPYLLPFWAMIWTGLVFLVGAFVEIPHFEALLCGGLGASMTFHLLFTLWMSSMDQSDFRPNGLAFSMFTILLVNCLWLVVLLCWGEPDVDAGRALATARDTFSMLVELGRRLLDPSR